MKIFELSKELGVANKELIEFFKDNGYKVSSHMQPVTDEMHDLVISKFTTKEEPKAEVKEKPVTKAKKPVIPEKDMRTYSPDDLIPCKSVVPWRICISGLDKNTSYLWNSYGDIEYVTYRDLQSMRRRSVIKDCKIVIEDPVLCERWKGDLGGTYKYFLGVEYPEELFDVDDKEFEKRLKESPDVFKDVIKFVAIDMIRNQNYPSVSKLNIIDDVLGTGIKEFI